ncbi:hypothetical protein OUZ56_013353 [Daphnia magna]|uniref:Uncharacterized protein n=1 Tax=Daphnia magna TaxID=35525 RepID=A0ABQ9Z5Q2_9CRUS|nr:hypothetical protein OUZ56_013353 [Daphnia magna]
MTALPADFCSSIYPKCVRMIQQGDGERSQFPTENNRGSPARISTAQVILTTRLTHVYSNRSRSVASADHFFKINSFSDLSHVEHGCEIFVLRICSQF